MDRHGFPSAEATRAARYSPQEEMLLAFRRQTAAIGTGEQVLETLHSLAKRWMVDEITVVTLTHEPEARRESYRLLASAA